jgi:hypothetical protein
LKIRQNAALITLLPAEQETGTVPRNELVFEHTL